ncbi:MAG TPA: 2-C-methyl-D-erythritol 4-phosphate cytidylyltransferase [Pyrinomonadaceae bacterium]|jgi:2-C-methyl-D-erythritol 4-phosphate cytidylyltransferase|nr:2-C-methyl-D-erythritol 4-phosphate cytidylyltransferase [Pyrinomonadaceae bacterium]
MNVAIIVAAGRGSRMGGGRAKQFREISGTPIIIHTLRRFEQCAAVAETTVVLPDAEREEFLSLSEKYGLRKLARAVAGGETRALSVWNGLRSLSDVDDSDVVAVHDGVRPFVGPEEIERAIRAAEEHGAAILAAPAVDTIKEAEDGRVLRTHERSRLWHAQTPQCFRLSLLRRAYESALAEGAADATDDSALVERLGVEVRIVEGGPHNIKVTTPRDFALAEMLLREVGG